MSELNEKLATAWEGFTKGDWQNEFSKFLTQAFFDPAGDFLKTFVKIPIHRVKWDL